MRTVSKVGVLFLLSLALSGPVEAAPSGRARPASVLPLRDCTPWQVVPVPDGGGEWIDGIDGLSSSDFFAVVNASYGPHPPKILHWDGSGWAKAPIEGKDADLSGIDVISSTDAWAVGTDSEFLRTKAFHWDGSVWTQVPVPSPEGGYDKLEAVSATSSSDVWAVGFTGYSRGLIVHWDGTRWSSVPNPKHQGGEEFWGVRAIAPDDVWAVGGRGILYSNERPLIEHWDGTRWSEVRISEPQGVSVLSGIDSSGPDDVWAVGFIFVGGALVYHWDGTTWTKLNGVPHPSKGQLSGVSVLAPDDVWVAGAKEVGPPIAAHWDGSTWRVTKGPAGNQWFADIKAFTRTTVWAAGGGANGILAARFAGCS